MAFYPSENNSNRPGGNNPSLPAFDLQAEKQRIGDGTEEIRQELLAAWQKKYANAQIFPNKLSSGNTELIEFLLSFKNTLFYNDIAKKFSFSAEQRDLLPQIVWNICLAKNWYGLESLLQSEMKINSSTAGQITILVNQNILFRAKELGEKVATPRRFVEEKISSVMEKISIQEAMRKYPEVGEQLITSERITLKSFPSPVRPSIKNWLADYNFVMGFEKQRSGIERTNYLFHSINTQKLNPAEREKVSYVLRSYDENSPVTINKNARQAVFPAASPRVGERRPSQVAATPPKYASPGFQRPATQTTTPRSMPSTTPEPPVRTQPPIPKQASPAPARPAFQAPPISPKPDSPTPVKPEFQESPQTPKEEENIRFTSPHTLPFEKGSKGQLQPHRITPFSVNLREKAPENETKSSKNVINLKE